jgi:hypothetical protein
MASMEEIRGAVERFLGGRMDPGDEKILHAETRRVATKAAEAGDRALLLWCRLAFFEDALAIEVLKEVFEDEAKGGIVFGSY